MLPSMTMSVRLTATAAPMPVVPSAAEPSAAAFAFVFPSADSVREPPALIVRLAASVAVTLDVAMLNATAAATLTELPPSSPVEALGV